MTYSEGRNIFREKLKSLFEVNEIDFYFKTVLQSIFNIEQTALALSPTKLFNENQKRELEKVLKQLLQEQPLQYIIGKAYFRSLTLTVNSSVLIPRPETEELVNWVLEDHQNLEEKQTLIDFGTGSGCIPIALSQAFPHASITAIDVSEKALAVARENANKYKSTINWELKNILSEKSLDQKYDLIVSNPPYVRALEKVEMSKNVLAYEPELALFVTDKDPLIFYKKISELAFDFLSQDGLLFFEINEYLGEETTALIKNIGFKKIVLKQDMYLKNRMIMAKAIA